MAGEYDPITGQWIPTLPVDPLSKYKITDLDTAGDPQYFGYVDTEGNWYIMELTATTARYIKGTTDYAANWIIRGILVYDYLFNLSW